MRFLSMKKMIIIIIFLFIASIIAFYFTVQYAWTGHTICLTDKTAELCAEVIAMYESRVLYCGIAFLILFGSTIGMTLLLFIKIIIRWVKNNKK